MKTRAAVLWDRNKDWSVEEIELDPPKQGEVLVSLGGSGLCHSDEHVVTGDLPTALPVVGGHEGAGIVQEVGPGVTGLAPGDRVIFSFMPSCGQCRACASGMGSLCEIGRYNREGRQISDHTARHHARGQDLGLMCLLGTFAEHTVVHQASCVKIEDDLPLDIACLLGCGVITGWGSVAYTGEARVGDVVVVVGVGGIGINAVQAAVALGAEYVVAVDPVAFKRSKALEFGASHAVASSQEAAALLTDLTRGRMAQVCVNTMGVGEGDQIGASLGLVGKRGRVVVTNIHPAAETQGDDERPGAHHLREAGPRLAVRLVQPARPTSPGCSSCTAAASSSLRSCAPAPTALTRSTSATTTCATAATSAGSSPSRTGRRYRDLRA